MFMLNLLSVLNNYCRIVITSFVKQLVEIVHHLLHSPEFSDYNLRTLGHGLCVNFIDLNSTKDVYTAIDCLCIVLYHVCMFLCIYSGQ